MKKIKEDRRMKREDAAINLGCPKKQVRGSGEQYGIKVTKKDGTGRKRTGNK